MVNSIRGASERDFTTLEAWRTLVKVRACPQRTGAYCMYGRRPMTRSATPVGGRSTSRPSPIGASTTSGDVRVGETARRSAPLTTASGEIEFGIGTGIAVQLDVYTRFGPAHNRRDTTDSRGAVR
jgi:hypothetical protein